VPELAIIVPTLNERSNVEPLLARVESVLAGIQWEVIFVDDDSADGTAALVRQLSMSDPRVRIVQRVGRRGLSSAVVEGMLASAAPYLAVMDGDLQHDERLLPAMLGKAKNENLDVVIASRHIQGGSVGEFSRRRSLLSDLGKKLSRFVCHQDVSDPMSGYFLLSRSFFEEVVHRLSGLGFKILLDILASSRRPLRIAELGYTFGTRLSGESKMDTAVGVEYILLLADKLMGDVLPVRFALFALVGLVGVVVHLAILGPLHFWTALSFLPAQAFATLGAMISNFLLNNLITYHDRRLRGWAMARGLLTFFAACSIGAVINFALAQLLTLAGLPWYTAGLGGIVVGSVWNFGVTAIFTWRRGRGMARDAGAAGVNSSRVIAAR
jgi:dolichol-phosphate mannosyltransferase